jgi:hypothetical protein
MARPARPWFRFYVEAMRDPKMRRLTPAQRWLWVAILAAARESPIPGVLMVAETEPMALWELADYAGMKQREIAPALDVMFGLGMVRFDEDRQAWAVSNFTDRQYESDNSAERVAKHRELKRDCNGGITPVVTDQRQRQITDTDKTLSGEFELWWHDYPVKKDKAAALKAFKARRRDGVSLADLKLAQANYLTAEILTETQYLKRGGTFLNGKDGPWSEYVQGIPAGSSVVPSKPEPVRPILGRGVDAEPMWDIDEHGNAVRVSA